MGTSRSVWDRLDHFRTSRLGIAVFYGYLVGILVAVLIAALAVRSNHAIAVKANHAAMQAKQAAADANRSLCAQKAGYQTTYTNAKKYLRQHPNGTKDFSKDVIVAAILNAKTQLAAFKDVTC